MAGSPEDIERERDILASWQVNASSWVRAVQERQIASREQLTNRAIVDTLTELAPATLLDIGCGEGWLCREMGSRGIDCLGIDAVAELVSAAKAADSCPQPDDDRYQQRRYEDLNHWQPPHRFDCAVCNFSLIGRYTTEAVFTAMSRLITTKGHLVVQTLHPLASEHQQSGWQVGSWAGFSEDFRQPAPWYFRTLSDWYAVFDSHGLEIVNEQAPTLPDAEQPASLILVGRLNSQ